VTEIQAIAEAAMQGRADVLVLCHGGPIAMPEDARHGLKRVQNCLGFYGSGSIDRLPVELAIPGTLMPSALTGGSWR